MKLIYAELIKDGRIVERGIFIGICEFMEYRKRGWSGTDEVNRATDEAIESAKRLQYLAS
jgi:hypothetical protein